MRIYSRQLWNAERACFSEGTLSLEKGRIESIRWAAPQVSKGGGKILDFGDLKIGPSSVDLHIHSRGFDEEHKESFESLEAGALRGGVSVMACMANTRPRLDSVENIREFLKQTKNSLVEMLPFGAVTEGLEGKKDTDWERILQLPVVGLSDDGKPIADEDRFVRALKITKKAKKILSLHEEDLSCSRASVIHQSPQSLRAGLPGSPASSETIMVERDLQWSARLKAPIHLCHLSSAESVQLIRKYRQLGALVSAELTPHHGLLSIEDFPEKDALQWSQFKVCPVIRTKKDREALLKALRTGEIDCFASDHAPHSRLEKDRPMESAAHGIVSLENHFPLYAEVKERARLSWARFFELSSERPAQLLGRQKDFGSLRVGCWANFIVFEELKTEAPLQWGCSKSQNGPWENQRVHHRLLQHWIKGRRVYEEA
jgi:dihydroorotase